MGNNKQINEGRIHRPPMTDEQAIQQHLGGYLNFLRMLGVPTPTRAEAHNLLYSELYVRYMQEMQRQQRQELENIQQNLPMTKQALQMMEDVQKYGVNIGQVLSDAKQKKDDESKGIAQAEVAPEVPPAAPIKDVKEDSKGDPNGKKPEK